MPPNHSESPDLTKMHQVENISFTTTSGIARRAAIGLIVLASDYTIEDEWRAILAEYEGVALFQSRILNDDRISLDTLRAMERRLTECTEVILPGNHLKLNVVAFGCTSATMAIGEERVFKKIHAARPEAACTTPITAAFAALKELKSHKIGVLTPYSSEVNKVVARHICQSGFEVPVFGSFNENSDATVARISPESIKAGIRTICDGHKLDAVFVSCTSIRIAEHIADIEAEIGIPVISSNQAMAWHALRLSGVDTTSNNYGRLFKISSLQR